MENGHRFLAPGVKNTKEDEHSGKPTRPPQIDFADSRLTKWKKSWQYHDNGLPDHWIRFRFGRLFGSDSTV
jgi:hypothetical protein